jgi:solute carrier family 25 (mitochondrial phosphate transporter), member 23/24/25/41
MPTGDDHSTLHAVLSFYSSIVTVNAEGDSFISEDTLEGLGMVEFLLETLFGSLLRIANSGRREPKFRDSTSAAGTRSFSEVYSSMPETELSSEMDVTVTEPFVTPLHAANTLAMPSTNTLVTTPSIAGAGSPKHQHHDLGSLQNMTPKKSPVTDSLPDAGYFLAGAVAGAASRTGTAPLDRLKTYLLVNTNASTSTAWAALKQGHLFTAVKNATLPVSSAIQDLYKAGGVRTFFAGEFIFAHSSSHMEATLACYKQWLIKSQAMD